MHGGRETGPVSPGPVLSSRVNAVARQRTVKVETFTADRPPAGSPGRQPRSASQPAGRQASRRERRSSASRPSLSAAASLSAVGAAAWSSACTGRDLRSQRYHSGRYMMECVMGARTLRGIAVGAALCYLLLPDVVIVLLVGFGVSWWWAAGLAAAWPAALLLLLAMRRSRLLWVRAPVLRGHTASWRSEGLWVSSSVAGIGFAPSCASREVARAPPPAPVFGNVPSCVERAWRLHESAARCCPCAQARRR